MKSLYYHVKMRVYGNTGDLGNMTLGTFMDQADADEFVRTKFASLPQWMQNNCYIRVCSDHGRKEPR